MDRDVRGQAARSSDPLRFVGQKWPIQVFLAPLLLGCVSLGFVFWLSRWLKLPPVAVCLIVAALMWCASSAASSFDLMFPAYLLSSVGLALIGAAICISGVVSFSRAGTTVNPMSQAPPRLFLSNALALALIPVFVVYTNRFQIGPEERALASLFGYEYLAYNARVRRVDLSRSLSP